jgi:thiamine-phosphate pyrophosphorylase
LSQLLRDAPLYAILDTGVLPGNPLSAFTESLLRAGVRVFQYRHKEKFHTSHFNECCALAKQIHRSGGLFLVNDRADVASLCGADGVHLGQQDLLPEKARKFLGENRIIGYSTHSREQAIHAAESPVDYVAIGPVFATGTKRNPDPVVGASTVAEARTLIVKPLIGIGGITLENAPSVLTAGADAVAVISDLMLAENPESHARRFLAALR